MEQKKMPFMRVRNYLVIVFATLVLSVFLECQRGFSFDKILAVLIFDSVYLAVVLYMLESCRIGLELGSSASNDYSRIAGYYGMLCVVTGGFYFLPPFTVPAAAYALLLGLAANREAAAGLSTFLCLVLCSATGGVFYEISAYCILVFIGTQMAKTLRGRQYRLWGCILLVSASVCIPPLFYYLAYAQYNTNLALWNGGFALLAVFLYSILADRLYDREDFDRQDSCEAIIKEDYPLVKDIKNYSKAEYIHAIKVATIAGKCAAEIGADEITAAAAGFYYRLGILEGEPFVENGVRLAQEHCFPTEIIQILSEYNGEQRLPSSKESAIVHMVDACIKRIEMLASQNLSSSWNQDMVIYQTLNESSAAGIYDESGVSMNQFLKIRELMVREEIGYDSGR